MRTLILSFAIALAARAQSGVPAPAAAKPNTFFVTWKDPRENAFQVGVPQGWQVSGGMVRTNTVEAHAVIRTQSPDGKIQVFYDDPDLHPREEPNQLTQFAGIREGQTTQGAWGGPVLMARYVTGTQFAQQYAQGKLCRQPVIIGSMDLREPSAKMNAAIAPYAAQQQSIAQANIGEVNFRCGNSTGYVLANTLRIRAANGGGVVMWFVYQMGGYQTSDPEQAGLAFYVLNTMFETLKPNPEWEARVAREVQDLTGSVTKMQQAMAQSIAQYGQRQASAASAGGFNHPNSGQLPTDLRQKWANEDISRQKGSDAMLGQTWVHSSSGANVRVDNSVTNWWQRPGGDPVPGPESGGPPAGGGFERLTPGWQ
jgi:hypothetical protein